MTPDLLHQLPAIILAGVCTYLWLVARDQRKAADRFNRILRIPREPDRAVICKQVLNEVEIMAQTAFTTRKGKVKLDGPGRVIRRSAKRVMKK